MAGRHRREQQTPRELAPGLRRGMQAAGVTSAVLMTVAVLAAPQQATPDPTPEPPPDLPSAWVTTVWAAPRITTERPPPPTSEEVVPAETTAASPTAEEPPPPPPPPPEPEPEPPPAEDCSTDLAGTKPHVAQLGHHLAQRFGVPLDSILGLGSRPNRSDHPLGLAIDLLVGRSKGDEIAAYVVENADRFGISYVIWWREIWSDPDRGWRPYSGASPHTDHVHISVEADASVDVTC